MGNFAKFAGNVSITSQGQVTIPLKSRKELKIEINSEVYWYEYKDMLILVKNLSEEKKLEERLKK